MESSTEETTRYPFKQKTIAENKLKKLTKEFWTPETLNNGKSLPKQDYLQQISGNASLQSWYIITIHIYLETDKTLAVWALNSIFSSYLPALQYKLQT